MLGSLYNTVNRLRVGLYNSRYDAMLVGSLIKQIKTVDLLQSRQRRSVHGVSVATAVKAIGNLSSPA